MLMLRITQNIYKVGENRYLQFEAMICDRIKLGTYT